MDDTLGYVSLRSEDWDFTEAEQIKSLKVVGGSGSIDVGLAPMRHSQTLLRRIQAAKNAGLAPVSGAKNKMVRRETKKR
jgi:hypothetical protein